MKTKFFLAVIAITGMMIAPAMGSNGNMETANAPEIEKASFKVSGNCGMCENRIEGAAQEIEGVKTADWDKTTKVLEVEYNTDKTSLEAIHQAIADVGHDTEKIKAKQSAYEKLHACCQYER